MADLKEKKASQAVKVVGSNSTGTEDTYVEATTAGGFHTNLRNSAGTEIATAANPARVDPTGTTAQPASQAGTWNITNVSGTVSLPTGASTSANQTTEITSLQIIDDIPHAQNAALSKGVPMMGQLDDSATIAATEDSVAVARITAQRAVHSNLRNNAGSEIGVAGTPLRTDPTGTTPQPASQSGTWDINNISGTISLPTGAATAANQATQITALQIIDDIPHAQNATLNKGVPMMGQLDDTSTTAATEDAVAVARITAQRAIHSNLRNNAGTEVGTVAAPLNVQLGDGTDTQGVTTNKEAKVVDGLRNGGTQGAIATTTANVAIEAKVGGARLTNRKLLVITVLDPNVYYGFDNTVTVSSGTPVANNQVLTFSIDADSTFQIWLVSASTNRNFRILECP